MPEKGTELTLIPTKDHGKLLGLADDDHVGYVLRSILTADGDIFIRSGGVITRLAIGANGQILELVAGLPSWQDNPAATIIFKTAIQTVNNSTVLVNDTHLLFAVAANEVWEFTLLIVYNSQTITPKFDFAFVIPAGGSLRKINDWAIAISTLDGTVEETVDTVNVANQYWLCRYLYIGAGAAGNVQFQWAQNIATVEDTNVNIGSYIIAHQLA